MSLIQKIVSNDKSIRLLWDSNGRIFESATIPFFKKGFYAVCLSTQSGCKMNCSICATCNLPYDGNINLAGSELIEQAVLTKDLAAREYSALKFDEFSFMGMGEPMCNLDNLYTAVNSLASQGYSSAVSTIGFLPGLKKFVDLDFVRPPRLQISLHGILNRQKVIPLEVTHPFRESFQLGRYYALKTKTPLSINWVLLKGVNDSLDEANLLGRILDPSFCRLNITEYVGRNFVSPTKIEREEFLANVKRSSREFYGSELTAYAFDLLGKDIEAGCGQLVGKFHLK